MSNKLLSLIHGEVLEEGRELTLAQLCRICGVPSEHVLEMVEQGILDPEGGEPAVWRFRAMSVQRVRCARSLQQDLGVNLAGAALAIDLLEELQHLRQRLRRLGG